MVPSRPQAGADLAVHRARATGWRGTRAQVARWLEDVPIASLGLGPEELLYLPRLRVRVPAHQGHGAGRMPDRIITELRALLAGAESGWGARFSPDRAYRFTSRGRYFAWLVALLVRDGSAPAADAFQAATGTLSLREWQRAAVLPDGAVFVATVARLAEIGCAARWIERFDPADIVLARHGLERRFALRLEPAVETPASPITRSSWSTAPQVVTPPELAVTIAKLAASGDDWHRLTPAAKTLLLAVLVLAHNPALPPAQATLLAEAIARTCASAETGPASPAAVLSAASAEPELPGTPRRRGARANPAPRPIPGRTEYHPGPSGDPEPAARVAAPPVVSAPDSPILKTTEPTPDPAPTTDISDDLAPLAPQSPASAPAPPTARRSVTVPFFPIDAQFTTGFGGLLFLINAFVALGLYPDFTAPLGARLNPSPLWLAGRIGRHWFGASWRHDPLAAWLAEHAAPGRLPGAWRAEPDWLTDFATIAAPRSTHRRGRITLWHPAGFPLVDERERFRSPRSPTGFRHARNGRASLRHRLPSDRTDRWAACLAYYLDARLRLLCGAGLSLLVQPAHVKIRDLDLTATFALDRHPIGLRIAGLDRNPGWSPAEGRTIAFVFE